MFPLLVSVNVLLSNYYEFKKPDYLYVTVCDCVPLIMHGHAWVNPVGDSQNVLNIFTADTTVNK